MVFPYANYASQIQKWYGNNEYSIVLQTIFKSQSDLAKLEANILCKNKFSCVTTGQASE